MWSAHPTAWIGPLRHPKDTYRDLRVLGINCTFKGLKSCREGSLHTQTNWERVGRRGAEKRLPPPSQQTDTDRRRLACGAHQIGKLIGIHLKGDGKSLDGARGLRYNFSPRGRAEGDRCVTKITE